jgi:outer membrane autotransporter protein
MKSKILALAAAMACTGAFAQQKSASESMYIELGFASAQYNFDAVSNLSNANHLNITLGKNLSENFSVEGIFATGMNDSTSTAPGYTVNAKLSSSYGLYVKPKTSITNSIEAFARVGFFSASPSITVPTDTTQNQSIKGTSASYGLGASMKIAKNVYGNLDWMQIYKKDGVDIKGFGLSVGYKF